MNLLIVDSQEQLNAQQIADLRERLHFSLVRFADKINGVTLHVYLEVESGTHRCMINASVERVGMVSVKLDGKSWEESTSRSICELETQIEKRSAWASWLKIDAISDCMDSISLYWNGSFDKEHRSNPRFRWPQKTTTS